MEWVELLKITGPVGFVLIVLVLAPWGAVWYLGKWVLERYDRRIEADTKLATALEGLTNMIDEMRKDNHRGRA